jgi:hypothetical protein
MRRNLIAILGIAGGLMVGGCTSASDDKPKAANSVVNTAASNSVAISNGTEIVPPQPADANGQPSSNSTNGLERPGDSLKAKLEAMRKSGKSEGGEDAAVIAQKHAQPAPDNSTFASFLTDAGYEIRTFKSHPQLLKVEKKTSADGTQALKIFLRGGKVVELPGQRITSLSNASAAYILEVAGIQPVPQPQPKAPTGPVPTKKSGE